MSGIFEESRLISLLREFDASLALSYLEKLRKFKEEAEKKDFLHLFIPITDPSLTEPIAFRIEFSEPILVMLSHPLCRMHARIYYPIEFEWERFYVTQLGMLPVYLVDLNIITLIKFWAEASQQASPQTLTRVLSGEAKCMKLSPTIRSIHYSTMNFIIPFGASLWKMPEIMDEIMSRYLKYSLWLSPKPGFSFSTHFLHGKASIKYLLKVAKTLCLIDEIKGRINIQIMNKLIKVRKVSLRMLVERNGSFYFMRREAFAPEDVLNELSSTQSQDKVILSKSFLNAIVLEIKEKAKSFEFLSVVSDIGASYFELAQTMIGYVLLKIFNSSDKVAYVCNFNELRKTFNNALNQIWRHLNLPPTISDRITSSFDLALESHYPIFIKSCDEIYYMHPLVFSFLYSTLRSDLFQKEGKEKMIKFLNFLEKMNDGIRYMELYLDETLNMFHGESKRELLSKLFRLIRKIEISKLLQTCF